MIGLESMSLGRPVIAFDSGGISDWLTHEVSGLLVPQANVPALTHALQQALSTPGMVRRLGFEAARHCHQRFDHRVYLGQMQAALARAAERDEGQLACA